jgi:hypothetical protein
MSIPEYPIGSAGEPRTGNPDSRLPQLAMHESAEPPGPGLRTLLLSVACVLGGVVRDTVYVTLDALRGRYDH